LEITDVKGCDSYTEIKKYIIVYIFNLSTINSYLVKQHAPPTRYLSLENEGK